MASNDCGVRVLSHVLKTPYDKAKQIAFQCGWSSARGMYLPGLELACQIQGIKLTPCPVLKGRRAGDCTGLVGVYILHVHRHVLAVDNGFTVGLGGFEDRLVLDAWKVGAA